MVPVFVLAYLLKIVFAVGLPGPLGALAVLPASGRQDPRIDATHITNFYVLDGLHHPGVGRGAGMRSCT